MTRPLDFAEAGNSTDVPLASGETFTGVWYDVDRFASVVVAVKTDQDGTYTVQFSPDGVNADSSLVNYYHTDHIEAPHRYTVTRRFFRVQFTNTSASNQTYIRLSVIYGNQGDLNIPTDLAMPQHFDAVSVRPSKTEFEIALGLRNGYRAWDMWGYNDDIDTGTEVVRSSGGSLTIISTATTFTFVSTSANDTNGGTGCEGLVVYYIDADRIAQTAVVMLSGLTPVVTSFTGLGINRIAAYSCGSGMKNAGTITGTATTGGSNVAQIPIGTGTSQTTVFYTQANHNALVDGTEFNIIKPTGGTDPIVTIIGWMFSFVSNSYYQIYRRKVDSAIEQTWSTKLGDPFLIGEKSIFWFEATTTQNDTQVSIRYSLVEVRDFDA